MEELDELLYELLDIYFDKGRLFDVDVWSILEKHNMTSDKKYSLLLIKLRTFDVTVFDSKNFKKNVPSLGIKQYYKDVAGFSLLSSDDEKKLFNEYYNNNTSLKKKNLTKEKIIGANLRLVVKIAQEFAYSNISLDDLIQEGNMGLLTAFSKYDINSDNRFETYAYYWIKQAIFRYISNKSKFIRLPENLLYKQHKIVKEFISLTKEYGREPSLDELSTALNISSDYLYVILSYLYTDVVISEDEYAYEDNDNIETRCDIVNSINALPEEEKLVVLLKHYVGYTFSEIADITHKSTTTVCSYEKKAVLKLKEK